MLSRHRVLPFDCTYNCNFIHISALNWLPFVSSSGPQAPGRQKLCLILFSDVVSVVPMPGSQGLAHFSIENLHERRNEWMLCFNYIPNTSAFSRRLLTGHWIISTPSFFLHHFSNPEPLWFLCCSRSSVMRLLWGPGANTCPALGEEAQMNCRVRDGGAWDVTSQPHATNEATKAWKEENTTVSGRSRMTAEVSQFGANTLSVLFPDVKWIQRGLRIGHDLQNGNVLRIAFSFYWVISTLPSRV